MNRKVLSPVAAVALPPKAPARAPVRTTHESLVAAINDGVMRRRFVIGQRLVEGDLSAQFGVSRGTVREALKALSAAGVVTIEPHRGAVIRALSRPEATNLLLVLEVLCGLTVRLATENLGRMPAARQRLSDVVDRITGAGSRAGDADLIEARAHFYECIMQIAGNPELDRAMPLPQIQLFRTQFVGMYTPREIPTVLREYRDIHDAMVAGDPKVAEQKMTRHLRRQLERVERLPDTAFRTPSA